jgi:hypothetical protein
MVAAVAFVIGIGIGLKWGPFASRGGRVVETPVAHHAERPAKASSEMTPTPPDAPDTPSDPPEEIDAGRGTAPPEQQPQPTHPVEPSR